MNDLGMIEALVLGFLQAVTEFLPVSSSGHLAVAQTLMDLRPDAPALLIFDVAVHVGTVIAVLIVFAPDLRRFLTRLTAELGGAWTRPRYALRITLLAVAASIPTALIGLLFKDDFEAAFAHPVSIAAGLVATGLLLAGTARVPRARRGWRRFGYLAAILVGVAQGLAIWPGISRSGATICVALFCGLRRRWAAQFSFLLAVPAILGATLLQVSAFGDTTSLPWGPIVAGGVVAAIAGYVSLRLLLVVVQRSRLHYFALYCWAFAAVVLVVSAIRARG